MSSGGTAGENPDQSTLRRASLKVAFRISAACAVMVIGLLAATALYLVNQLAHPEVPGPAGSGTAYAYLDSRDVLAAMVIAGAAGSCWRASSAGSARAAPSAPSAMPWPGNDVSSRTPATNSVPP